MPHVTFLSNEPYRPRMGSTNRQRLARAARASGWDVDFIETVGWLPKPAAATVLDGIRVRHLWNLLPRLAQAPNHMSRWVCAQLDEWFHGVAHSDLVVSFDPLWSPYADRVSRGGPNLYYCLDAYEEQPQFSGQPASVLRAELRTVKGATHLAATSPLLAEDREARWGRTVAYLPGSFEPWVRADATPGDRGKGREFSLRTMLLVSALDTYKVDVEYMSKLLEANPDWQLSIVGDTVAGRPFEKFHDRLEIHPSAPFSKLEHLAARCELGLIALRDNAYSRYSFPLKTWDYFASGLPVFAAGAPSLAGLEQVVQLPSDPSVVSLSEYLAVYDHSADDLRALALKNTADKRWVEILDLVGLHKDGGRNAQ